MRALYSPPLALGAVGSDEIVAEGVAGEGELLLRPTWWTTDTVIRTGQVIRGDAGDAFARKDGVRFHANAATLADGQTVVFLERHLKAQ